MQLLIPVSAGLESTVKRQLSALGYDDCPAQNGRIAIHKDCTWQDVARLNVFLRSGERVLILLAQGKATTFDELYELASAVEWENWLSADSQIRMDGKSYQSRLGAIKAAGGVVKKAIVRRIIAKRCPHQRALREDGARSVVGVSIVNDVVTLTLDTSGDGLHKRGYRSLAYSAPLKETMAAAMLDLSVYNAGKQFADLFCGSGTLPVEAAMKALKIAPGIDRDFDFSAWKCAPKKVLDRAKEEARDLIDFSVRPDIYACDINPEAISIARYHAKRAGVEKYIRFECRDMSSFTASEPYGVIISNPPYGERLGDEAEVRELYRRLGRMYRNLPDWSLYILTACPDFERFFGKRSMKKKKLFNANLLCNYYTYLGAKPQKEERRAGENSEEGKEENE